MSELFLKVQSLDKEAQQEVADFVDFLIEKRGRVKKQDPVLYRQRLMAVSVWSDEDIKPIEEARQHFNNWKAAEW